MSTTETPAPPAPAVATPQNLDATDTPAGTGNTPASIPPPAASSSSVDTSSSSASSPSVSTDTPNSTPSPSDSPSSSNAVSSSATPSTSVVNSPSSSSTENVSTDTGTDTITGTDNNTNTSSNDNTDNNTANQSTTNTATRNTQSASTSPSGSQTTSSISGVSTTSSSDQRSSSSTDQSSKKSSSTPSSSLSSNSKSSASSQSSSAALPAGSPQSSTSSGLSTGTIIGISLAGFIVFGILIAVMGSLLKYRRKKMLERKTAHLKRASNIWDLGDSAGDGSAVDKANEKAAANLGGAAPFAAPLGHKRQESAQSSTGSLDRSDIIPPRPMPAPPMQSNRPLYNGQRGWANRVSRAFMAMRPAPAPPLPMQGGLVGQSGMSHRNDYFEGYPDVNRQDSFGARAYAPPRNAFFPPPLPQHNDLSSSLGTSPPKYDASHPLGATPPLSLPGARR